MSVDFSACVSAGRHKVKDARRCISMIEPRAKKAIPLIKKTVKQLSRQLGSIAGILIEEKKFSTAVHYRLVDQQNLAGIKDAVDKILQGNPSLRLISGKKVFEILRQDRNKVLFFLL